MGNPWIVLLICVVIALAVLVALYFWGSKQQKKQASQKEQLMANAQMMHMLIIDKKMMKLKDANLPKMVVDQTPKYLRGTKVPIVKAKIGPKIATLLCDESVFDQVPVKAEIKAKVSGLYIIEVNNFRNAPVPKPAKKGFLGKLRKKTNDYTNETAKQMAEDKKKKKNK